MANVISPGTPDLEISRESVERIGEFKVLVLLLLKIEGMTKAASFEGRLLRVPGSGLLYITMRRIVGPYYLLCSEVT